MPRIPKGAYVLGGVANTGRGGGGCEPTGAPKVTNEGVPEREGLEVMARVHAGVQPPEPSNRTPR